LASVDSLDVELLYAVAEAQKQNRQVSTWTLAKKYAKKPSEINSMDGMLRYRLNKLAEKGLLQKVEVKRGKKTTTLFKLPPKTICYNGSFFIFSNPITILACPYHQHCPSQCNPIIFEKKQKIAVRGCHLIRNAPEHIKQLIYQHLSQP